MAYTNGTWEYDEGDFEPAVFDLMGGGIAFASSFVAVIVIVGALVLFVRAWRRK